MGTFSRRLRCTAAAILCLAAGQACAAGGDFLDAIEYYYPSLDHYFVTANPSEIAALDGGTFPGWQRTSLGFKVYDPATAIPGLVPVCRFYGRPQAGLDSHFYSASASECDLVKQRFPGAWEFESNDVFLVALPDLTSGACPSGSVPIYRAWNNRADSNHRYTTDPGVQQAMVAKGYIAEGYGPVSMPVAMCSPTLLDSVPACTLVASDTAPVAGTSITLTALCSGNPTRYNWTGCASTGQTCTTSSPTTGLRTYSVVASNSRGSSPSAAVSVNWVNAPPPPVCSITVTTDNPSPPAGSLAMLNASCSGDPTGFTWAGCSSASAICLTRPMTAGQRTYSLIATNAGGASSPATATINWQDAAGTPPGLCSQFPSMLYTDAPWSQAAIYTAYYGDFPAFAWNGVWVIKFTVAGNAAPGFTGRLTVSEWDGPPTGRDSTLSTVPCDFRPTDPAGANGPLSHSTGTTTTNNFVVGSAMPGLPGLSPGQTYYLNVRNWDIDSRTISCAQAQQRCDALLYLAP